MVNLAQQVKDKLATFGYLKWEKCNVWEYGITETSTREIDGIHIWFSFHFESQCNDHFMVGRLRSSKQLFEINTMSPTAQFEIDCIMFEHLDQILKYEQLIIKAIQLCN